MTTKISNWTIHTQSPEETVQLGNCIGKCLKPGQIVALIGDLGAGKTWLSRGIGTGLGILQNHHVHSPAFDLVHEHPGTIPMFHMDIYRLDDFSREDELWISEYLNSNTGVCVIEWANKFIKDILDEYLEIHLKTVDSNETERILTLISVGDKYTKLLENIKKEFTCEFLEKNR
ncbi:ATP-binding protein [Candidatus Magnetomorum sp. HK-1]|nr:ATP-binding protein [Candidatus Magnetomorum sp. HK-1]